tara:strand:- start:127 stop:402 length:276 start_codon:yes stop_codon:yes gene_type:complete
MSALKKAIEIVSGGNQTHFAAKVSAEVEKVNQSALLKKPIPKLSQQLVHYYLKNDVECAAHFVPIISNLTKGEVALHELRPDIYPVQEHAA